MTKQKVHVQTYGNEQTHNSQLSYKYKSKCEKKEYLNTGVIVPL